MKGEGNCWTILLQMQLAISFELRVLAHKTYAKLMLWNREAAGAGMDGKRRAMGGGEVGVVALEDHR